MIASDAAAVAGSDDSVLAVLRELEQRRIEAIRLNDVDAMAAILDDKFLYINSSGAIYDKGKYLRAVASHQLTYAGDVELTETDHRIDGDVVIIAGEMLGHARLDGEPQVYHLKSMRVWRHRKAGWKLLSWQSSTLLRSLI